MHKAMALLRDVVRFELAILVACFSATIGWRILRATLRPESRLAFRSLFGGGIAGAVRVQLLVGSVVFALLYVASALQSAGTGALPRVPNYALALLAGSQAAFLGAAWRSLRSFGTWRGIFRSGEEK